jgi:hypothetical protein
MDANGNIVYNVLATSHATRGSINAKVPSFCLLPSLYGVHCCITIILYIVNIDFILEDLVKQ